MSSTKFGPLDEYQNAFRTMLRSAAGASELVIVRRTSVESSAHGRHILVWSVYILFPGALSFQVHMCITRTLAADHTPTSQRQKVPKLVFACWCQPCWYWGLQQHLDELTHPRRQIACSCPRIWSKRKRKVPTRSS